MFLDFGIIFAIVQVISSVNPSLTEDCLQVKELLDELEGVLRALDRVTNGTLILVDLVVVTTHGGLVAEEVDVFVCDATRLLSLGLEVLEAVGLVPASREDVEGDLATDGETAKRRLG